MSSCWQTQNVVTPTSTRQGTGWTLCCGLNTWVLPVRAIDSRCRPTWCHSSKRRWEAWLSRGEGWRGVLSVFHCHEPWPPPPPPLSLTAASPANTALTGVCECARVCVIVLVVLTTEQGPIPLLSLPFCSQHLQCRALERTSPSDCSSMDGGKPLLFTFISPRRHRVRLSPFYSGGHANLVCTSDLFIGLWRV